MPPHTRSRTGQLYATDDSGLGDALTDNAVVRPILRQAVHDDYETALGRARGDRLHGESLLFHPDDFTTPAPPLAPPKRLARPFQAGDPALSRDEALTQRSPRKPPAARSFRKR